MLLDCVQSTLNPLRDHSSDELATTIMAEN